MKHPLNLESLYEFLALQQMTPTKTQQLRLSSYLLLLRKWSHRQNLMSRNDIAHIVERHFLPSLLLFSKLPDSLKGPVIDVGSGAGFPGIILKIMQPGLNLTLLDSSRKKVIFLKEVCEQLAIKCALICQRSETYQKKAVGQFELIVSRAVAKLGDLWNMSSGLLNREGKFYVMKGGDLSDEINDIENTKVKIKKMLPPAAWLDYSKYLENKYIVMMER